MEHQEQVGLREQQVLQVLRVLRVQVVPQEQVVKMVYQEVRIYSLTNQLLKHRHHLDNLIN